MEVNKKQFKIVFNAENCTYAIWTTNDQGDWRINDTFITKGDSKGSMINVEILWKIDYWSYLGYEFIGIKASNLY